MKLIQLLSVMLLAAVQGMAQTTDITAKVKLQAWSDPVTIFDDDAKPWTTQNDAYAHSQAIAPGDTTTLTVVANPTVASTFCFDAYQGAGTDFLNQLRTKLEVKVDGTTWRTVNSNVLCRFDGPRFFIDLAPGQHTIAFVVTNDRPEGNKHNLRLGFYGLMKTDRVVTATVTEPGSLGQEILYDAERLADVRRLKVTGKLNDADWTTIGNMSATLWEIDLSGITNTEIPGGRFRRDGAAWAYLNKAALPAGLTKIGNYAFHRSYITQMAFPGTLQTIEHNAFNNSMIETAILPDSYCSTNSTTEGGVFWNAHMLKKLSIGPNVKVMNEYFLTGCISLENFTMPPSVEELGTQACHDCWINDFGSLSNVKRFGQHSMRRTGITAVKLDNVTWMHNHALSENIQLTNVEIGERFYRFEGGDDFWACPKLTTFKVNSPTVCQYNNVFRTEDMPNITLQVPNYLVNSYKADGSWLKLGNITGFGTEAADWLHIQTNLTLGARQRMEGRPNVDIANKLIFKIGGEAVQQIDTLRLYANRWDQQYTQLVSTSPNVDIATADLCQYTYHDKWRTWNWYPICLPYDVCVDDIRPEKGDFAVRYYDGANRAANGATGSWKDFEPGAVIPAGTGFIYQASTNGVWSHFPSHGTSANRIMSPNAHTTPLAAHAAEVAANQNWNLVGNPYQCYYDAKRMEFNSPITVFTVGYYGDTEYTAYSLTDDDYILRPNEAFFVQRPEGVSGITFALAGKQTESTVVAAGAKATTRTAGKRQLVDLTISDGQQTDRTRLVVNELASADYEMNCDASKFFGTGLQAYTLGTEGTESTCYAINERPLGNGTVALGIVTPADGEYSFALTRNEASRVVLVDNETGTQTDLTADGAYTFQAAKGTSNDRFVLRVEGTATGITTLPAAETGAKAVYDLTGRLVGTSTRGLKPGIYLVNGRKMYVK